MLNGIGSILKQHRLAKGLTINDVEEATKIRGKYLEAIEEENFDVLPGKVYLKGFVRSYIKFLDIGDLPEVSAIIEKESVPDIVEEKQEEEQIIVKTSAENMVDRSSIKRGPLVVGLGILAIALLISLQSCSKNNQTVPEDNKPDGSPIVEAQPEEPPVAEPNEEVIPPVSENEEPVVEQSGLNLVVSIVDAESNKTDSCWMKISADGQVVYEGTLSEGATQTFQATDNFYVTFGNAGAVQLTLNNQDLGVAGSIGKVVKKEINAETLKQLPQ